MSANVKSDLYKAAGVDIDLATELLEQVKRKFAQTRRPEMLAPVGGFGGLFQIDLSKYREPVLVSSIDGVGTKLMIAMMMEKYDTVGHDIVNHCIDDIAVQGAEPLYFMDYIGIGKLRSPLYEEVLTGIADACKAANCAILGGETAEMPGMYGNDFDLVGVITGVVEKSKLITGERIRPGHVAIGFGSSGLHTNGFSLARKILFSQCSYNVHTYLDELGETVGEALLRPHICYYPAIREAQEKNGRRSAAAAAHLLLPGDPGSADEEPAARRHRPHHRRRTLRQCAAHSAERCDRGLRHRRAADSADLQGTGGEGQRRSGGGLPGLQHGHRHGLVRAAEGGGRSARHRPEQRLHRRNRRRSGSGASRRACPLTRHAGGADNCIDGSARCALHIPGGTGELTKTASVRSD